MAIIENGAGLGIPLVPPPCEYCVYCGMCACHFRSPMDSRKTERRSVYGTVSY